MSIEAGMRTPPRNNAGVMREPPGAPARVNSYVTVASTYTDIHRAIEAGNLDSLRAAINALPSRARTAAINFSAHPAYETGRMTADMEARRSQTPLQIALLRFFEQPTADQAAPYRAIMEELLGVGADLKVTTDNGLSILAYAATQATDTTSWHPAIITFLIDRVLDLPADDRASVLAQKTTSFFNGSEIISLHDNSAFLVAVACIKPNIAALLLPLMSNAMRQEENASAQMLLEQLYERIEKSPSTILSTASSITPDVRFVINCLKAIQLLVQYGAPDTHGRVAALTKYFLPNLPGQSFSAAIQAVISNITWEKRKSLIILRSVLADLAKEAANAPQQEVVTPPKSSAAVAVGTKRKDRDVETVTPPSSTKQPRFSALDSSAPKRGTDGKPLPATTYRASRHAQTLLARALEHTK